MRFVAKLWYHTWYVVDSMGIVPTQHYFPSLENAEEVAYAMNSWYDE